MNITCGLGNIIWLYVYLNYAEYSENDTLIKKFYNIIPMIVFVNGILYHICIHNSYMKWYDIICNSIFVIFINYYTCEKLVTNIVTFLVVVVFYCNYSNELNMRNRYVNMNDIIHVLFVNYPLLYLYMICEI